MICPNDSRHDPDEWIPLLPTLFLHKEEEFCPCSQEYLGIQEQVRRKSITEVERMSSLGVTLPEKKYPHWDESVWYVQDVVNRFNYVQVRGFFLFSGRKKALNCLPCLTWSKSVDPHFFSLVFTRERSQQDLKLHRMDWLHPELGDKSFFDPQVLYVSKNKHLLKSHVVGDHSGDYSLKWKPTIQRIDIDKDKWIRLSVFDLFFSM